MFDFVIFSVAKNTFIRGINTLTDLKNHPNGAKKAL